MNLEATLVPLLAELYDSPTWDFDTACDDVLSVVAAWADTCINERAPAAFLAGRNGGSDQLENQS